MMREHRLLSIINLQSLRKTFLWQHHQRQHGGSTRFRARASATRGLRTGCCSLHGVEYPSLTCGGAVANPDSFTHYQHHCSSWPYRDTMTCEEHLQFARTSTGIATPHRYATQGEAILTAVLSRSSPKRKSFTRQTNTAIRKAAGRWTLAWEISPQRDRMTKSTRRYNIHDTAADLRVPFQPCFNLLPVQSHDRTSLLWKYTHRD
ncbi:hypothetical protein V8C26DRAFT_348153 [Trichoderma gracile]